MLEDCIKLLCYALYGQKKFVFNIKNNTIVTEMCNFINLLNPNSAVFVNGNISIKPMQRRPLQDIGELETCSDELAYFLAGVCSQLDFLLKINSVKPVPEKKVLDKVVKATGGLLQLNSRKGDLYMCSLNYDGTSSFTAIEPVAFSAGMLAAMPLAGVNSVFNPELMCYNELILCVINNLQLLEVPFEIKEDKFYIETIAKLRFTKKARTVSKKA